MDTRKMRGTRFSIRVLLLLILMEAVAFLVYPYVAGYFVTAETKIEFPDSKQWEQDFDAARLDRLERESRLRDGIDTVDDAMNRFVNHDFLRPEELQGRSGWFMTTGSGAKFHRSTLQRQSRLFECLGKDAVPSLVEWLGHEQIEIRYIASFALENITGLNSTLPHFATLDQLRTNGWLENTRAEYRNWIQLNGNPERSR